MAAADFKFCSKNARPQKDGRFFDLLKYEALCLTVQAVITENGREFCVKPEQRPYEISLAMEDTKRCVPKTIAPRANGFVERVNRKLPDPVLQPPAFTSGAGHEDTR